MIWYKPQRTHYYCRWHQNILRGWGCSCKGHSGSSLQMPHLPCSALENVHDYRQSYQNLSCLCQKHANWQLVNLSDCHCHPHCTIWRCFEFNVQRSSGRGLLLAPTLLCVLLFISTEIPSLNARLLTPSSKYPLLPSLRRWSSTSPSSTEICKLHGPSFSSCSTEWQVL